VIRIHVLRKEMDRLVCASSPSAPSGLHSHENAYK